MKKKIIIIVGVLGLIAVMSYAFLGGKDNSGYIAKPKSKPKESFTNEKIVNDEVREEELKDVKPKRSAYELEGKKANVKIKPMNSNRGSMNGSQRKPSDAYTNPNARFDTTPNLKRYQPMKISASLATRKQANIRSTRWLPSFRLIKCRTVNTSQSLFPNSPIIVMTTEDVYHHGVLVIPKGVEIHGKLSGGRQTNRAKGAGSWTMVMSDGKELPFSAQILHRGDEDQDMSIEMSAGVVGKIKERNPAEMKKLMVLTGIQGALEGAKQRSSNAFGTETETGGFKNAALNAVSEPVEKWLDQQFQRLGNDPYFLEVQGGTAFYLYTLNPLDMANAKIGGSKLTNR